MHVHLWHGIFGRATNIEISLAGERRMDAALHADFRAAAFPGFAHAAADFVVVDEVGFAAQVLVRARSEEHTSELQSLMRTSYAVFCLKTKQNDTSQQLNTKLHMRT